MGARQREPHVDTRQVEQVTTFWQEPQALDRRRLHPHRVDQPDRVKDGLIVVQLLLFRAAGIICQMDADYIDVTGMSLSFPIASVALASCFASKDARRRCPQVVLPNAAILAGQTLMATRYFKTRTVVKSRDVGVIRSSVDPGPHLPSDPSGSWKIWLFGVIISVVLPFFSSKWGPFLKIKNEVEAVVEKAEIVTETIEKVAEGVEKVAEEIEEHLPAGGKLRDVVSAVDKVAKIAAKDAGLIEDVINKVEDVEKDVDSFMESIDSHKPVDKADGA